MGYRLVAGLFHDSWRSLQRSPCI